MKILKHYRPELVVSKGKEPNPLLTDPYLDAKEDRLVATDGHALVAIPVETDKGERSRYLACSLLAAGRMLGNADQPAEIKDEEIVEFGVLWPAAQERTFPAWRKLVPPFKRGDVGTVTLTLNARLLKSVADAMGSAGGVALTYDPGQPDQPILVTPLTPDPDELGLLMPLRADEDEVGPGQRCPKCRKLLAAGAACPEHGRPDVAAQERAELEQEADELLRSAGDGDLTKKELKGPAARHRKATTMTVTVGGKSTSITGSPAEIVDTLERAGRRVGKGKR